MASIQKVSKSAFGGYMKHCNRTEDDGERHSNEMIDPTRTHLNYYLKKGTMDDYYKRLEEVYHSDRNNIVPIIGMAVTLPQDVPEEDERKFFEGVYKFYQGDFREENIINAVVHKDETTPHMHLYGMPCLPIDRDNLSPALLSEITEYEKEHNHPVTERLCAKEWLTRNYYVQMHPRLYKFMSEYLGYECEILNGATAGGNKTILELKNETLSAKISERQAKYDSLNSKYARLLSTIEDSGIDETYFQSSELIDRIAHLQKENEILYDTIENAGIPLPKDEIKKLIEEGKQIVAQSKGFVYKDGIYKPDEECTNLVEIFKNKIAVSPNRAMIADDEALRKAYISASIKEPTFFDSSTHGQCFIIPTDNIEDTFRGLMKLKEEESKVKKLIAQPISNDTYGITECILRKCSFDVDYYAEKRREKFLLMEFEKEAGIRDKEQGE